MCVCVCVCVCVCSIIPSTSKRWKLILHNKLLFTEVAIFFVVVLQKPLQM
ncbi:MAG: hypothetical protein LBP72_01670 [Dysgonamonadaceae bacterium]|nr:hypothetical protein [Dysgonamonadaceae bacterium]